MNKRIIYLLCIVIFLIVDPGHARAANHPWTVSTFAGSGIVGIDDGTKLEAQFHLPLFATVDFHGTIYVADTGNHLLRKITKEGDVHTIAGKQNTSGDRDGQALEALFNEPKGLAFAPNGTLYIADAGNGKIRTLGSDGTVSTFVDGLAHPSDIVFDQDGSIYVTETLAHRIIRITMDGQKTVVAGGQYETVEGWLKGNYRDGRGTFAQFNEPSGLALADNGMLYIADVGNQRIRAITPDGQVKTVAGSGTKLIDNTPYIEGGYQDGPALKARFDFPNSLTVAQDGAVYVADSFNHVIRKISPNGIVSTVAGTTSPSFADGVGTEASFDSPSDILMMEDGHFLIVDQWNHALRLLTFTEIPPMFKDLEENWAKEMIEYLAGRQIIKGYPDGTFRPNEFIQRQQVALMFTRAFDLLPIREAVLFKDVPTHHPSYEAITKLQQAGVIDGSNGAFHLNEPLTRAQMAKMLVLACNIAPGGTSTFKDVPATHWSYSYIAALADRNIALGSNGNFMPNEPVTRAQFAAFLYRAIQQN